MFSDTEIKQIFYMLDAKFFCGMTTGQSAAILRYEECDGLTLWFHLDKDDRVAVAQDSTFGSITRDRDEFCKILADIAVHAVDENPYLSDWLRVFKKGDGQ